MGRPEGSTHERKGKHLNRTERIKLEAWSRHGVSPGLMSEHLGRDTRTIERELSRGQVEHRNSDWTVSMQYSSDRAQDVYDLNATAKGPSLKLGSDREASAFIRRLIVDEGCSPEVVSHRMKAAGLILRISRKLSTPFMPGIITSMNAISKSCSLKMRIACSPL